MSTYQTLRDILETRTTEVYLKANQRNMYVRDLQQLLNQFGLGQQLNFQAFGATGFYDDGTIQAVRTYGQRAGIPGNGSSVSEHMLRHMLQAVDTGTNPFAAAGNTSTTTGSSPLGRLQSRKEGDRLWISDGSAEVRLLVKDQGYAYWGTITIAEAVARQHDKMRMIGLSESALNVIQSVSENEGKIDAINSYDRAFFSYGIFQWTLGMTDGQGELPALLKKLKDKFPSTFRQYFGSLGLDIHPTTQDRDGLFVLNGQIIDRTAEKEAFRQPEFAFYFWKAAQHGDMQAVQIEHALSRLETFYWTHLPEHRVHGHPLSEIITSEFGVALLLDHHVNRPNYVKPCVEQAMLRAGLTAPAGWTTAEENRVLTAYLDIRTTYSTGAAGPMTKAREREQVTRGYLQRGIISDQRGSFRFQSAVA